MNNKVRDTEKFDGEFIMMPIFFEYLVELRDSGETNMWEAATYLQRRFNLTYENAKYVLLEWIKSFDPVV